MKTPVLSLVAALLLAIPISGPTVAAKTMSDEDAAGLFASTCGFCHANGGREQGKGPKLMGTKRSDAFIINRIKQGKEGLMPSFKGALSDGDIRGILHYIRNLKPD
jgi:mono/diheme cytochrome c family protein